MPCPRSCPLSDLLSSMIGAATRRGSEGIAGRDAGSVTEEFPATCGRDRNAAFQAAIQKKLRTFSISCVPARRELPAGMPAFRACP